MPVLPPPKRSNRRVKFRDVAQFDVVRGVERARVWPEPKLSNQTPAQREQQDWFRQANWAFKYMDGNIQSVIRQAVHLTALYPRDLFTIMAANRLAALKTPDGRILYPMPARQDVSESLDTLGPSQGFILIKGSQFWECINPALLGIGQFNGGCKARKNANTTTNFQGGAIIDWDGADDFDTDGYHSPSINPSRITTKPGDEYVELTCGVFMSGMVNGSSLLVEIHLNGTQVAAQHSNAGTTLQVMSTVSTGPLQLTNPGTDYFQVYIIVGNDTSTTLRAHNLTFFSYKKLNWGQ